MLLPSVQRHVWTGAEMSQLTIEGRKLPDRQVCLRYGVCNRTLSRWDRNPELNFPKPIIINHRKYRDEEELEAWDRVQATNSRRRLDQLPETQPPADTKRCNQDPSSSTAGSITVTNHAAVSDTISTICSKAVKAA
jgi:hypothetical protein